MGQEHRGWRLPLLHGIHAGGPGCAGPGYYLSFSGIITFKNAQDLRDVVAFTPLDRILIETDSPYLAPVPYRGKTNNPSFVPHVAQQVAQCKGIAVEEVGTRHQPQL